jgi:hypothetical protein
MWGPSSRQMTWNNILSLWLCVDCQYAWSNWIGSTYSTDMAVEVNKPKFLKELEKEV